MPPPSRRSKCHRCTKCNQCFTSVRDARIHINGIQCLICSAEGPDPSGMRRHCQHAHNILKPRSKVHYERFNESIEWKEHHEKLQAGDLAANASVPAPAHENTPQFPSTSTNAWFTDAAPHWIPNDEAVTTGSSVSPDHGSPISMSGQTNPAGWSWLLQASSTQSSSDSIDAYPSDDWSLELDDSWWNMWR
ncbi:hypothetical protein CONPUDRAFT_70923 [Coniophora puteana RWD-64-598 SS2]|uniref:Uncharacterized protein n=1 Tax=Coniophora puteana (strain RWD-64-598) TaxID=741705 RepID=A0A5M3MZJ9_CONPW|nr:uncharacterized protein CONPUDRAFT_70923 [Coniophora puteana RWD-64-598 SS2]EIW84051.1 hypothetical protein CONPUDRAFT_70923 [Coniophora puteana RWD-64-598 SS2]